MSIHNCAVTHLRTNQTGVRWADTTCNHVNPQLRSDAIGVNYNSYFIVKRNFYLVNLYADTTCNHVDPQLRSDAFTNKPARGEMG